VARFRKKPAVVEADQWWPGRDVAGVCTCLSDECGRAPHVHTAHGGYAVRLEDGDWVIPEPNGDGHYPCKPDIFQATYEPVPDGGD
jgi:hypothetical protein